MKTIQSKIYNPSSSSVELYNSMDPDPKISPFEAIRTLEALEKVRLNPSILEQITKEEELWMNQKPLT